MTKQALVLMTALVPTTGHSGLIGFASEFPDTEVNVLIMGRSFEPVALEARYNAVSQQFAAASNIRVRAIENDYAPQNPEDVEGFWPWWKRQINRAFPEVSGWDFVVASESYGLLLAETLDAKFMPYDLARQLNEVSGTQVRENIAQHWDKIMPSFKEYICFTATLFGQESVGKTTLAGLVSNSLGIAQVFEYARPYQEILGAEVDEDVMENIYFGQLALQKQAVKLAKTPAIVQDTDLFSTVGYWSIMGKTPPARLIEDALALASSVYYLLPDDGPFVPDALRYGIDERESTTVFWEELLANYGLTYVLVPEGSLESKQNFIASDIAARASASWALIKDFQRE